MAVKRMDNVLIVVDDLEAVKAFFIELGLALEGETTVEGPLVGGLIGLEDVRAACGPTEPSSSARCSTRTAIGWPTSAARRGSSSA
jgi:hypothetical protein